MKHLLCIILISCFAISCSKRTNSDWSHLETITVDISKLEKMVDLTNYLDTSFYHFIPLETNDDCLIGHVENMWLRNDKIIVYDDMSHGVFIFNLDGSYHARVRAVGNGPGEYPPIINDVTVTDSYIYILVPAVGYIYQYNHDGKFIQTISLNGSWANSFFTFDDDLFGLIYDWGRSGKGYYLFYTLEAPSGEVNSYLPYDKEYADNRRGWGLNKYYSTHEDHALILYSTLDVIHTYTPGEDITPRYYVDIVKDKIPDKIAEGNGYEALRTAAQEGYITGIDKIFESSKYILLQLSDHSQAIYNKEKKETENMSHCFNVSAWNGVRTSLASSSEMSGNIIVSSTSSEHCVIIKEEFTKINFTNKKFGKTYMDALNQFTSEMQNPMITLLKFKE